ncbi:MAG: HAD-IA family hydrolase, partial [Candidatus Hydrothermarchaeota archaeon]
DLNFAMRMVMAGAELVCAGASAHFRGSFHGDEGLFLGEAALAQAIAFGASAEVTYVGKPYPEIFRRALELKNAGIAEAVMVGDTLRSDIRGARELGITSILVTQGSTLDLGGERPDLVVRDVGELYKKLF